MATRREHPRDLTQGRPAIRHVLEHIPHVDEIEAAGRQRGFLERAMPDVESEPPREPDGVARQLDTRAGPATVASVFEQPAGGASDVQQAALSAEGLEGVEQSRVLVAERLLIERRPLGTPAAEVGDEILFAVQVLDRLTRRLHG